MSLNRSATDRYPARESHPPVLLLPMDFSRHNRTYAYATTEYALSEPLTRTIRESSREGIHDIALPAAAYFAWIYRLSGEQEMAAGLAMTAGDVPVFVSAASAKSFGDLRDAVRGGLTSTEPPYDGECETRFAVGTSLRAERELLNWQLRESDGGWRIVVEYDASLFREATIVRYIRYYVALLEAALADPSASFAGVDLLTEEDAAVYAALNATEAPYDRAATIHGMIERAAARYPDKTAVSSDEGKLTYRQLNERANQTARMLIDRGLRKGQFVTILMERSTALVASLLGVLKAGGAYVPVDPEHPDERNRYIVEDTESAFVLTKGRYAPIADRLCAGIGTVKAIIDVEAGFPAYDGSTNPNAGSDPGDLAYVIYTSGSTGRPKGALIAHEGVVNLGESVRRDCRIGPDDVLTQFATYSFDASVWDTIGALFYGAELYLLSPAERMSVEAFASAVERTGTTIVAILPTVFFNQLSAYLSDEGYRKLSRVHLITVAGEALYGEQVRAFQRKFKDAVSIVNVYGPTECTVCTTTHTIRDYIPDDLANVPIGRPIGNYKVYIVNEENRLCPVNVHGEVLISTVGLAKGYLNQPEKTREAFVPNPFEPGGWIYKSGDFAKLLPDGTIEYVGRRDSQIKIRGHRIEIGEIEDAFAKIPNVQNIAVVPKKEKDGQNMLVGFFTSKDGGRVPAAEIKRLLGEKLPSYFVPKQVVQLEDMPISPTGKIDRKKLAGYELREDQPHDDRYAPPANETQAAIAAAWQEGLELSKIGIHDDFFEIGGDSLAIIHVLVLLKPRLPDIGINDFFECRTIEKLAERAEQLKSKAAGSRKAYVGGEVIPLEEHPAVLGQASASAVRHSSPAAVLLTGATGYLGAYLLYELLVQSEAKIICIARSSGADSAQFRIQKTMAHYFGPSSLDLLDGRVYVVEGDLSQPGLGLSPADGQFVRSNVDAILHSAADVRHFGDAEHFDRSNVLATRRLIELAETLDRGVRFHHISTLGIPEDLALSGQWEDQLSRPAFDEGLKVDNLYTQSKLEAEKWLMAAANRGLDVNVYRAGNLSCHADSGQFQQNIDNNAFYRMIKAMLLLGKAPAANWDVDFTPIDYAGRSIVHLALRPDTAGRLFHICNPEPVRYDRMIEMLGAFGYPVETLDFADYANWLFDAAVPKDPEALKLAIAQLEGDGAKDSDYRYGCRVTSSFLADTDIRCAPADESYLRKMIGYAVSIGYFPEPKSLLQADPRGGTASV
ncbi:non-ribosomal peptide synthetase [Cohnella sp. JJ-181]|uniref:non-ribosomal peptide synthetase n=1 Tax=Cohnella rhizoplanae TaxID=2974897 RepID=UPI0022FF917E|nr:non-ribosomal peptide synthetase [Cohnella sp. JJ-181]CAI6084186.1 Linear gramicidin synthase subunit D [Cohnella sp. JJ-181]